MRLRLILSTTDAIEKTIPVNYQYPLSSWIYHTIAEGNHEFSRFLHDTGFISGVKSYKLFTFSQLTFPPKGFRVENDRLHILGNKCYLIISFMAPSAVEHFIRGIFANQEFTISDQLSRASFKVNNVEILPEPVFSNSMNLRCISPVVIGKHVEQCKTAEYLAPGHISFNQILGDNLIHKFTAAVQAGLMTIPPVNTDLNSELSAEVLKKPRKWGVTIKANTPAQTKIIGYTFDFRIIAPSELIQTGYICGFGEKNAMGMGCVELI